MNNLLKGYKRAECYIWSQWVTYAYYIYILPNSWTLPNKPDILYKKENPGLYTMIYDSILCSPSGNEHVYLVLKYLDQLEEYLSTLEFNHEQE